MRCDGKRREREKLPPLGAPTRRLSKKKKIQQYICPPRFSLPSPPGPIQRDNVTNAQRGCGSFDQLTHGAGEAGPNMQQFRGVWPRNARSGSSTGRVWQTERRWTRLGSARHAVHLRTGLQVPRRCGVVQETGRRRDTRHGGDRAPSRCQTAADATEPDPRAETPLVERLRVGPREAARARAPGVDEAGEGVNRARPAFAPPPAPDVLRAALVAVDPTGAPCCVTSCSPQAPESSATASQTKILSDERSRFLRRV